MWPKMVYYRQLTAHRQERGKMNTNEWNNAKVGQTIRGETVKLVDKGRFGISRTHRLEGES